MSTRNFVLFIIILIVILLGFFGFLYFRQGRIPQEGEVPDTNFLSQFNPFNNITNPPVEDEPPADISDTEPPAEEIPPKPLLKVSSMPIAGYAVFMKERHKETLPALPAQEEFAEGELPLETPEAPPEPKEIELAPALRYVDRATGNIYQTFVDKIEEKKFSATVIPKVYEAFFGTSGESVIMRYLKSDDKTIETFVGKLPKEVLGETEQAIEVHGTFLPTNVRDVSISPDGKNAFYLFDSGEITLGTILEFATDKKTQAFDSAFNEWLPAWASTKMITLATKPSYVTAGHVYKLDPSTKSFARIFGDIAGLTALPSPEGNLVLYADNTLALSIYSSDSKTSNLLGVRTLPEKCVWGRLSDVIYCAAPRLPGGTNYPDAWYQGEISFDDQIWRIDVVTGSASIILDPASIAGEQVDGWKLALDLDGQYLFFINKKDSFLWKLTLR